MDKRFLIIMGIIIVLFVGLMAFGNKGNTDTGSTGTTSNHVRGKTDSTVEVVAYKDFECPPCGQFHPLEEAVYEQYKDKVRFVFRHFPVESSHPNARAAHRAAEAAGLQGKFFEMQDLLFTNQQQWSSQVTNNPQPIFEGYAQQLELDIAKYNSDFALESTNSTINADRAEGNDKGVSGTPTFFINGTKMDNGDLSTLELFSAELDKALAETQTAN